MLTIPFRLADFMLFGTKNMMLDYWSEKMEKACMVDKARVSEYDRIRYEQVAKDSKEYAFGLNPEERKAILAELMEYQDPECRLAGTYYQLNYLRRHIQKDDDALLLYWEWLRDYVIIAGTESMQWYWDKYYCRWYDQSVLDSSGSLDHSMWLDIYLNGLEDIRRKENEDG